MNQFRLRFRLLIEFMQERKLELSKIFCLGLLSNMLSIIIPVSVGKYYDLEFGHASQRSNILNFLPEYFTFMLSNSSIAETAFISSKAASFNLSNCSFTFISPFL